MCKEFFDFFVYLWRTDVHKDKIWTQLFEAYMVPAWPGKKYLWQNKLLADTTPETDKIKVFSIKHIKSASK